MKLEQSSFRSSLEYERTFAGKPRIESLTGLRWVAALLVYFNHFRLPGLPGFANTVLANGYVGVTVFFVLSGFILTVNYASAFSRLSLSGVRDFAVARVARVYPAYLLVLVFVFVVRRQAGDNLHHWLIHVLALQTWSGKPSIAYGFNGPGWSIGVEFFLYACFPLLIFIFSRNLASSSIDCLILAGVVAAFMSLTVLFFHLKGLDRLPLQDPNSGYRWLYRMPVSRLGDFLLGICAAYLFLHRRHRPPRVWVTVAWEIGLVVVMFGMLTQKSLYLTAGSYDVIYAVPTAILLWFLAVQPHVGVGRVLAVPLLVALGEASYAFYLVHWPIKYQFIAAAPAGGGTMANLLLDLFELAAITALAWGVHVGFERPARRWVRNALSRRDKSLGAAHA